MTTRAMLVSLIVAMDLERLIGREGTLPWRLPSDLRRFRARTLGKPVVMGRKTYASIGRPLPQRTNIVLSRDAGFHAPGCVVVSSFDAALRAAEGAGDEVMVAGGAAVYAVALPRADRLYLSVVHARVAGDTYFPAVDPAGLTVAEYEACPVDEAHAYRHDFFLLVRSPPAVVVAPPADAADWRAVLGTARRVDA